MSRKYCTKVQFYLKKDYFMDSVKDRLKNVSKKVGEKSVKAMCNRIGVSYDAAGNWGKRNKIADGGILAILTNFPQISETYLRTGDGDILKLDTGISNYGHDARKEEVCIAYDGMSNEDKKFLHSMAMRLKGSEFSHLDGLDILSEDEN